MVLGPEQVITIFHNYLRSSVTKFRGSRSESMSPGSSVVQVTGVIGGVGHRGHRVVDVTVINDTSIFFMAKSAT